MLLQLPSSSRVSSLCSHHRSRALRRRRARHHRWALARAGVGAAARRGAAAASRGSCSSSASSTRYAEPLRVTYRMPLPADGAVSGYAFEIGERVDQGRGRSQGRRARAVRGRRSPRARPPRCSSRSAATSSRSRSATSRRTQTLVARITIDQRLAWLPEGEWELRFPTVIGPRYIGAADTDGRRRARRTSRSPTSRSACGSRSSSMIRDAITGGAKPSSPSHALDEARPTA